MHKFNERPLSRQENLMRLLFMHADELIEKLEILNKSADNLARIEVMVNGVDGAPGLIEVVECLAVEVKRVGRLRVHSSSQDMKEILGRLKRIEGFITDDKAVEKGKRISINATMPFSMKVMALISLASLIVMLHRFFA